MAELTHTQRCEMQTKVRAIYGNGLLDLTAMEDTLANLIQERDYLIGVLSRELGTAPGDIGEAQMEIRRLRFLGRLEYKRKLSEGAL